MATLWRVRVAETRHLTADKLQTTTRVFMDKYQKEADAQASANAWNARKLRTPRHPDSLKRIPGEELFLPADRFHVESYDL